MREKESTFVECVKSECAWYDSEQRQCAVLSINCNLIKVSESYGH